ncbi:hypothetical protein L1D29_19350 [Shewanella insulae]|uniref:hypothetical protein n=1 Tax=Shewanella insulae TaxID=2681496 RepID=UPI001EFD909E|nr:hypothetical protein [Shewanella insulae]MCG9714957.1 hypothetical protein [Shewanella insulae]
MPLPLLAWGAAAAVAAYTGKKAIDAHDDNSLAKTTNEWAENSYKTASLELRDAKESAQYSVNELGKLKFELWEDKIIPFVDTFSKIKNINLTNNNIDDSSELPVFSSTDFLNLKAQSIEMKEVISGGLMALGSGGLAGLASYGAVTTFATASTGASIAGLSGAASTNATLAWLGGGSLASGGGGIAAGTAVLGGLVAAPVLVVGGMILAAKAEAAKEEALANLAKAKLAIEEMKTAVVATNAIKLRFDEMRHVLIELNEKLSPMLESLQLLVKANDDYSSYSEEDKKGVMICASIAKTIKNLIDSPLLDDLGQVTQISKDSIESGTQALQAISTEEEMDLLKARTEPVKVKRSFEDILEPMLHQLNVGSYMYTGLRLCDSKIRKKAENAVKSYANEDGYDPYRMLLILIDTTIFGSGKEGLYITEDKIYTKGLLEDPFSIDIDSIERIKLFTDDREVRINSTYVKYTHSELNLAMEAIVNCIQEYIEQ